MAKDALEEYCDLEQSLPKSTIHRRFITNGYCSPKKIKKNYEAGNQIPISINEDVKYFDVDAKLSSKKNNHQDNGILNNLNVSNDGLQLAVLREVEVNINDVDKDNVENANCEIKRGRGRPKGIFGKKRESLPETNTESEDNSEKKSFSLRLDFLGRYQKHKTKIKRDKISRDSTEDNESSMPKKHCAEPLSNYKESVTDENSLNNSIADSEVNFSSCNKIFENDMAIKTEHENDMAIKTEHENENIKEESWIDFQTNEKIINVKPIEPRRRTGRPKGPPKPPKIKGKRGRKPKYLKALEENKSVPAEQSNEIKTQKIPGKRGRPRLYPDRPPRVKIPGRRVGRPPGPPKPFKPKGPRGRPRLIRINTSDRPHVPFKSVNTITSTCEEIPKIENKLISELKAENNFDTKNEHLEPKKKRGRPIGYSPLGKTNKRLGRPPKHNFRQFRSKLGGRPIGRPRKINDLNAIIKTEEDIPITNEANYETDLLQENINIKSDGDDSNDENSDISVTDKNWETIIEDSNYDSQTGSSLNQNGLYDDTADCDDSDDETDDDNNSDLNVEDNIYS